MKGTIQEKKGYLYVVINYKDDKNRSRQKWVSTQLKARGNKKTANAMIKPILEEFQQQLEKESKEGSRRGKREKVDPNDANMLFTDYCLRYVESRKGKLSKQTYNIYHDNYIPLFKKFFDKYKLRVIDITEVELKDFYKAERKRGIKEVTIKKYNNVLRPALKQAYLDKLIPDNPFDYLEPIHKQKVNISYYDKNEMKKFFRAIKGHPLEVPLTLAAYYGFRRSEVLGLRWDAVDFEHKRITINHKFLLVNKELIFTDTLKTATSCRTLPLIPAVEELLQNHKKRIIANKAYYGNAYNRDYLDYVCVEEDGKIVYPDHMTKGFKKILKMNGLREIRLHDLRHSCASNMLASGVPLKEIQEWLGHSNFSTTADVYSHLDFSFKLKAANTLAMAYDDKERPMGEIVGEADLAASELQEIVPSKKRELEM